LATSQESVFEDDEARQLPANFVQAICNTVFRMGTQQTFAHPSVNANALAGRSHDQHAPASPVILDINLIFFVEPSSGFPKGVSAPTSQPIFSFPSHASFFS
jgi:hypothetical protein